MKALIATLAASMALCGLAACASAGGGQYDGVSRFAVEGGSYGPNYGPGSPPRDNGHG